MVVFPTLNWVHSSVTTSLVKALPWSVLSFSGDPNIEMNPSLKHFVTIDAFWSLGTYALMYLVK